jgi:hypothetical protein
MYHNNLLGTQYQHVVCIPVVAVGTTQNITQVHQALVRLKLHPVLVCYTSSIRIDQFILTCIHTQ